jgi:hypothetical protein
MKLMYIIYLPLTDGRQYATYVFIILQVSEDGQDRQPKDVEVQKLNIMLY